MPKSDKHLKRKIKRFYRGEQWSKKQLRKLEKLAPGAPSLVFNRIKPLWDLAVATTGLPPDRARQQRLMALQREVNMRMSRQMHLLSRIKIKQLVPVIFPGKYQPL